MSNQIIDLLKTSYNYLKYVLHIPEEYDQNFIHSINVFTYYLIE